MRYANCVLFPPLIHNFCTLLARLDPAFIKQHSNPASSPKKSLFVFVRHFCVHRSGWFSFDPSSPMCSQSGKSSLSLWHINTHWPREVIVRLLSFQIRPDARHAGGGDAPSRHAVTLATEHDASSGNRVTLVLSTRGRTPLSHWCSPVGAVNAATFMSRRYITTRGGSESTCHWLAVSQSSVNWPYLPLEKKSMLGGGGGGVGGTERE